MKVSMLAVLTDIDGESIKAAGLKPGETTDLTLRMAIRAGVNAQVNPEDPSKAIPMAAVLRRCSIMNETKKDEAEFESDDVTLIKSTLPYTTLPIYAMGQVVNLLEGKSDGA